MPTEISYQDGRLAFLNNGTCTIKTKGKYLEDDITVRTRAGSTSAIIVADSLDSHGGIIREITSVDITNDTVDAAHLLAGYTAHDGMGNAVTGTYTPSSSGQLQTKTNINPTTSSQTILPDSGYDGLSSVQINAMPSGTAGIPTATKGTVSNHSVSVTPSVTNTAGYISGGTKTGTAVTVSASELVTGTKTISANGTGIDVTNYAAVDVAVSGDTPVLQTKSATYTPTTSQQTATITPDSGYDGLNEVDITINAMPSGTSGTPTATKGTVSNHSISITPSVTNTTGYITGGTKTGTAVSVSASELVSGAKAISTNGTGIDVTNYASVDVTVTPNLQSKTDIDPTTSSQTIEPDNGYDGLSSVQINAIASGSATTPATTITANPTITVSAAGLITATTSKTQSVTPTVSAGYVSSGTAGTITVSGSNTSQLTTQSAATITPTESSQQAVAAGVYTTGAITVAAIDSEYVGSDVPRRDETDLSASGATVTVPAGYYAEAETKSVAAGSAGTPTATKGTVSSHSITVTPSVTNTTGYITGSTKTGTAVTVAASELVSGTKSITANGTGIDVTNYASVDVAVPSAAPNLQAKTNISPTTSSQTIQADSGYDGLSSVQINAMPSGSATAPASIGGTSATVSTGTNTLTLSKTVSVIPSVTAGYVASGTAGNSSVSLTASVTTKAAATITPTKSTQTIASGTYLTGTQTIAAIPAAYQDVTSVTAAAGDVVSGKAIVDSSGTVVNGTLVIQHYYTGSSAPSSSTGVDGDIYLQTS